MKLERVMSVVVQSVRPDDSLDTAICLMDEHRIHHLPVIDHGRIVGILSDRDLLISVGWKLECERRTRNAKRGVGAMVVAEIMSKPVLYLAPDNEVHTAAHMMAEGKFHAMPILAGGRLLGIVTSTDLLSAACVERPLATIGAPLGDEVAAHMLANLRTIGPAESLHAAAMLMHEAHIRHLPVAVEGLLIGIVSDRDIRRAIGAEMIEDELAQQTGKYYVGPSDVSEIMTRHPQSAREQTLIIDAIGRMVQHRIGALPVLRGGGELVGMLTDTDMLRLVAMADRN